MYSPLMVIVQKLTMVAYALHDGKKNKLQFKRTVCKQNILSPRKVKQGKRVPWMLIRRFRGSQLLPLSLSTSAMSSTSTPSWLVLAAPYMSSWLSWTAQTFNKKKALNQALLLRWLAYPTKVAQWLTNYVLLSCI